MKTTPLKMPASRGLPARWSSRESLSLERLPMAAEPSASRTHAGNWRSGRSSRGLLVVREADLHAASR
jgi:hypothetical protein